MNPWQSALRLLIATLVLAIALPVWAQDEPAGDSADAESESQPKPRRKRREPSDWGDWRNYEPSAIIGMGITWDKASSSLSGRTRALNSPFATCPDPPPPGLFPCVDSSGEWDGIYAGGALNFGGRLRMPEFDVPTKPRLFINASLVLQRQDNSALASDGVPRVNWLGAQDFLGALNSEDKFLRVEQTVDPKTTLFVGIGAEFLLPIDLYDIRINTSVNYFRSKAGIGAVYDFADGPTQDQANGLWSPLFETQDLVSHGIAPGIGLDVDIGENEWVKFGFYTDAYVGFALSDTSATATLLNGFAPVQPGPDERMDYSYDRGLNISILIGIRLSPNYD